MYAGSPVEARTRLMCFSSGAPRSVRRTMTTVTPVAASAAAANQNQLIVVCRRDASHAYTPGPASRPDPVKDTIASVIGPKLVVANAILKSEYPTSTAAALVDGE